MAFSGGFYHVSQSSSTFGINTAIENFLDKKLKYTVEVTLVDNV